MVRPAILLLHGLTHFVDNLYNHLVKNNLKKLNPQIGAPKGSGKPNGGVRAGAGRPVGVPNKINTELKTMILTALAEAGGVDYLKTQAEENPTAFLSLIGKVLPMTMLGAGLDGSHTINLTGLSWLTEAIKQRN